MIINSELFDDLEAKAHASERLRMNFNLHDSLDAKAQRLFNALLPGTVMPIHRHTHSSETQMLVRGRMDAVFFDESGKETERFHLNPADGKYGVQIPAGQWHTIEVFEPSIIFEVKDGPYTPLSDENIMLKV